MATTIVYFTTIMDKESIINAVKLINSADNIGCLTGAGISAESGIPTFREKDGVWSKMNPMEWATERGFRNNPDRVWEWYRQRRLNILSTEPNPAHKTLSQMEDDFNSLNISTQNIDGLHSRAGSSDVLELHGNIFRNKCIECGKPFIIEEDTKSVPRCLSCGGLIRPDVVWFGEGLPSDIWCKSSEVAMNSDIYMVIGTSGDVQPAASLALFAKRFGATIIIINPEATHLDGVADLIIRMNVGIALTDIYANM